MCSLCRENMFTASCLMKPRDNFTFTLRFCVLFGSCFVRGCECEGNVAVLQNPSTAGVLELWSGGKHCSAAEVE
jgi:hypothetical protein